MVEGSYEKTTIREIAKRAEVSVGAVYLHFSNKIEILAALTAMNIGRLRSRLLDMIPSGGSGREKFEASLRFLGELRNDEFFALHDRLPYLRLDEKITETFRNALADELSAFIEINERIVREGMADGSLRADLDPHLVSTTLFIAAESFVHELMHDHCRENPIRLFAVEPDAMYATFAELLRSSMLPEKAY